MFAGLPGPFGRPSGASDSDEDEVAAPAAEAHPASDLPTEPSSAASGAEVSAAAAPAASSEPAAAVDETDEAAVCASVFRGLVFFVAREAPREAMLLVIRAFGGVVGWQGEGSPLSEEDASITHQVRDCAGLSVLSSLQPDIPASLPCHCLVHLPCCMM